MRKYLDRLLPDYLREIEIGKYPPPAAKDETDLPFNKLDPLTFQRFCCELLYSEFSQLGKDDEVVSIEPIGVQGQKQYGADIFVKRFGSTGTIYELYEVKRVEQFAKAEYLSAVNRFISNHDKWNFKPNRFFVITASNLSAEEIAEWQEAAQRLSSIDVEYCFLTPTVLNRKIQNFPDLVYQFFDIAWVEKLFGRHARRHYEKYGIYNFEESPVWLKYDGPVEEVIGDSFIIKNDHVKISGYLPTLRRNSATCLVEFRNGRFSHVLLTLNHVQLVERYFEGHHIPVALNQRRFLIPKDENYFCDIGNCRIEISTEEARTLCQAFDQFWEMYSQRVAVIEKAWRSTQFEISPGLGQDVPLLTIKRWLWGVLLDFAERHDAFDTAGDWAVFDSCGGFLKIYTKAKTERFDPGYHAFIKPTSPKNWSYSFRENDDEVLLIWQPPGDWDLGSHKNNIGPRYYWDAETTHEWILRELIPRALFWAESASGMKKSVFENRLKSKNDFDGFVRKLKLGDSVSSHKSVAVSDISKVTDVQALQEMVSFLQNSYAGYSGNTVYLSPEAYRNLHKALYKVLSCVTCRDDAHWFSYIRGHSEHSEAKDFDELLNATLSDSINSSLACVNSFQIDLNLRCINSCLRDCRSSLNNIEAQEVAEYLTPVLQNMRWRELLDRQKKRLLPQY